MALWHERDISHSSVERVALPDATTLLDYAQHLAIRVVDGMVVHSDRMRANLELTHGALYSQRALLALVESGRSRDDAYRVVQEAAQRASARAAPARLLAGSAPELDLDAVSIPAPSCVTRVSSWRAWTSCRTSGRALDARSIPAPIGQWADVGSRWPTRGPRPRQRRRPAKAP